MDQIPLVTEETDAGAELIREFGRYEPVQTAFWLKASDEAHRYLYIASERINDSNLDVAYSEILRAAKKLHSGYLDPFRVKLIGSTNPLAEAAVTIHQRYPGPLAIRYNGNTFGGVSVDDVYIYRLPLHTTN